MTAYEEIMRALKFYFGVVEDYSVQEIISQDHDVLATVAAALEDYRDYYRAVQDIE